MATNTKLSTYLGSGLFAALISFAVGLVALSILFGAQKAKIVQRMSVKKSTRSAPHLPINQATDRPWWIYTGGVIGSIYVAATIFAAVSKLLSRPFFFFFMDLHRDTFY